MVKPDSETIFFLEAEKEKVENAKEANTQKGDKSGQQEGEHRVSAKPPQIGPTDTLWPPGRPQDTDAAGIMEASYCPELGIRGLRFRSVVQKVTSRPFSLYK